MDDLITWLLEQIAEDERVAQAASGDAWDPEDYEWQDLDERAFRHIARWDPARVLAECEAKRFILSAHTHRKADRTWPQTTEHDFGCADCHQNDDGDVWAYGWCHTVRGLALPYVDRPGYREEWRP